MTKPEPYGDLVERDFRVMTGRAVKDIEALCAPDIIKTPTITYFLAPEGAETFPQLLIRATRVLDDLGTRHMQGSILLVTLGDLGKMLYAVYYGLYWQKILTMLHFGNSELLLLSPDSPPENAHVFRTTQHNH